jgi:hypothetical protein
MSKLVPDTPDAGGISPISHQIGDERFKITPPNFSHAEIDLRVADQVPPQPPIP